MIRKYGLLLTLMLVAVSVLARDTYWIPHVTKGETGIVTEIVISNENLNAGSVWFWSPNDGYAEITAAAGLETVIQADLLFPGGAESIRVDASLGLDLWVRYSGKALSETLTVPLVKEGRQYYRFEQARQPSIWQGLALVNLGERPVTVNISYYDTQRNPTGGSVLVEELGRYGKFSTMLADPRDRVSEGGWFQIHADQPVIAVVFSGGPSNGETFSMYHHQAQTDRTNQVRFTMTGGFGGGDFALSITPEKTCVESGRCIGTQSRQLESVLKAITDKGILQLRTPDLTQPCPDAYVMEVEIYWNGARNAFAFHDCSEDVPQEATEFVALLRQLREEIVAQ